MITQPPPLSLYIHTPWCVQKCPYCDFNSHESQAPIPEQAYVERLLFDLEQEIPDIWGRQLNSIFIGGGTPSLLSPASYEKLLNGIRALLPFHADMEITMEANPGTVESDKFKGFYNAGINRISIGVQSFNNQFLKSLGRIHSASEAEKAFDIARQAGFNNINLDLMYGLPHQSVKQAMNDLDRAISLNPEHLSWYQLTLEPNTLFHHQPPPMPGDERLHDINEAGLKKLSLNHFERYEISAFSRHGNSPSTHNLNYWQFGDYIGIGAGAHGKITRADNQSITRKSKKRNPKDYLNVNVPVIANTQTLTRQELPIEFMMNTMRLKDGVPSELFFQTTGLLFSVLKPAIDQAEKKGLLFRDKLILRPTEQGYYFLNDLLELFMPENFSSSSEINSIPIKEVR